METSLGGGHLMSLNCLYHFCNFFCLMSNVLYIKIVKPGCLLGPFGWNMFFYQPFMLCNIYPCLMLRYVFCVQQKNESCFSANFLCLCLVTGELSSFFVFYWYEFTYCLCFHKFSYLLG